MPRGCGVKWPAAGPAGPALLLPAAEAPVAVHHEHDRGDVDGRQGHVNHGDDSGPNRGGGRAGALKERPAINPL